MPSPALAERSLEPVAFCITNPSKLLVESPSASFAQAIALAAAGIVPVCVPIARILQRTSMLKKLSRSRSAKQRLTLNLEAFEDRVVPAILAPIPDHSLVVSPDDGGIPRVRIIDPATGEDVGEIEAYENSFRGGVRAAVGDVNNDGVDDIVIAPGVGGGPRVRIIDGTNGATLRDFFVYAPSFTGGVYVAVADTNGDGYADIITGTGLGGGPQIRVLSGRDLGQTVLQNFFAYEDSFRGGVQVAAGDVNNDGSADIIAGTGVGGGPRVIVFNGKSSAVLENFFAYDSSFRQGVLVGSGDIDGDGFDDVFTGSGPGGGPHARGFSGRDGHGLLSFFADDSDFRGGVRVDSLDMNGDGRDDFVTHTRHGNDDFIRGFDGSTGSLIRLLSRQVDDNPSGGGNLPPGAVKIEGTITAVDANARRVTIRLSGGAVAIVQAGPGTITERNDQSAPLSAFVVGERGEAIIGSNGIAVKIESGVEDNGGGSGGSLPPGASKLEGTITAVDVNARTVSLRVNGGTTVVRVATNAKIERNEAETSLSAFRVNDFGEALIGSDGFAFKIEATGA